MWRVHRKLKCSRVLFRPRIVLTINGQRDEGVMAVWMDRRRQRDRPSRGRVRGNAHETCVEKQT